MTRVFPKPLRSFNKRIDNILHEIDISFTNYDNEVIDIEGIVSHESQAGFPTPVSHHTFKLISWKKIGTNDVVESSLYIMRPINGSVDFNEVQPLSILKLKVYLNDLQNRAICLSGEIIDPEISEFKHNVDLLKLPSPGIKPFDFSQNEFFPVGSSLTVDEINKFEQKIGFSLPEEYVKFLLKFNGCTLKHSTLVLTMPDILTPHPYGYKSDTLISEFYSLSALESSFINREDLKGALDEWIEILDDKEFIFPDDVIDIAEAHFNILYAFKGHNMGRTYYYHHENLLKLSDSLEDLLAIVSKTYSINYEEYQEVEAKLKYAIVEGNFDNFRIIMEEFNGYELLFYSGHWLREHVRRLLVVNAAAGEEPIPNYDKFVTYLEERNLISFEAAEKWIKQYD
ncbi:SMI1/KNR4 family protein [Fibrella forsythiae]|uniref:SMI1/KNR4 family protein n=1 Tax=Fibrella forsythiae TaxID=2817061 RepID=A0ABS3JKZ3_9BACT|nr:SMI1/KNR4 family protein [Fibrella forsythiae]MBO0950678.1 SMI1/KNR4 family protein [Fibrella forsythiae]